MFDLVTAPTAGHIWNLEELSCLTTPFSAEVSGYGLVTSVPGFRDISTGPGEEM